MDQLHRIGNSYSVTALHKDNYENIYVQIRGAKHFVLLPPHCQPCVNEQSLRPATYTRKGSNELDLVMDSQDNQDDGNIPFATWDPDRPDQHTTPYSKLAEPMRVTLEEGDMLYLPAMWYVRLPSTCPGRPTWVLTVPAALRYHKVSQSCSNEGICIAVNYWYVISTPRNKPNWIKTLKHSHLGINPGMIWSLVDLSIQ